MNDLFGSETPPRGFRDIRSTRPSVAEEKAQLLLQLGKLINTIPQSLKEDWTVNAVRAWRQARDAAAKVAANKRASVGDLASAINSMRRRW